MRTKIKKLLCLISGLVLILLFQNCSSPFTPSSSSGNGNQNDFSAGTWDPEVQMTSGSQDQWFHGMSTAGDTIHLAEGNGTILYRKSSDEGATWGSKVNLGSGYLYLEKPMASDGSNVYITYFKNINNFNDWCCSRAAGDLYIRASRDGGSNWQPEFRLSLSPTAYRSL